MNQQTNTPPLLQQVETLAFIMEQLPEIDRGFADSLIRYYYKHHKLSEKQQYWVKTFIERHAKKEEDRGVVALPPRVIPPDGSKLVEHFRLASRGLLQPRLHVQTDLCPTGELIFYVAGETSSMPGFIKIVDSRPYPETTLFATISRAGEVVFLTHKGTLQLFGLIKQIIEDPAGRLGRIGRATTRCCFCCRQLENEVSLFHGYGPICADKWGLPWEGPKPASTLEVGLPTEDQEKQP